MSNTQLTTQQRTYLQDILDAKIIAPEHVVLLKKVSSELSKTLNMNIIGYLVDKIMKLIKGDRPPKPPRVP